MEPTGEQNLEQQVRARLAGIDPPLRPAEEVKARSELGPFQLTQLLAAVLAHTSALEELVTVLAAEVDRLRDQPPPPGS